MTRRSARTVLLAGVALGCTSSVPAPVPTVIAIPVVASAPPPPASPGPPSEESPPPASDNRPVRMPPVRARGGRDADVPDAGDATIRVMLASGPAAPRIASPGGLMFTTRDGSLVARAGRNEVWRVERSGRRVRAIRPDGVPTVWSDAPMMARPQGGALLSVGGKPYRGDLALFGGDTGVVVVNVVKIDDYVRGVVPLEIGTKAESDSAAVQAQAVTARSYAYIHLSNDAARVLRRDRRRSGPGVRRRRGGDAGGVGGGRVDADARAQVRGPRGECSVSARPAADRRRPRRRSGGRATSRISSA